MNKPAAKEPSMDEILSSIRQIIADDDEPVEGDASSQASDSGKSETDADAAMTAEETKEPKADAPSEASVEAPAEAPLELSTDQMISEPKSEADSDLDIEFSPASSGMDAAPAKPETAETVEAEPVVEEVDKVEEVDVAEAEGSDEDAGSKESSADLVIADDISFEDAGETPAPIEDLVSMPDPDLSSDMAEKLLEPTTTAAVGNAFAKLGALSAIGGDNLTLEAIVREMLRPMLKEWLDENLPATVERMVEKEIERVSRGS
jgi:cell pole-organizing protein PopZ